MPPSLTVLPAARPAPPDPLRAFARSERAWVGHLGDVEQLDAGLAVCNPDLPRAAAANQLFDAAMPPGTDTSPADVVAAVRAHFEARGGRCRRWSLDPSAPAERRTPLADHLASLGLAASVRDVLALTGPPSAADANCFSPTPAGMMVLPTRSAFRHARALAEEAAGGDAQLADAEMLHLDDPHCDGLIALADGRAAGWVTVLAAGDVGRVEQLFVAEAYRRRGIGRALARRAMEVCARSLFRQVVLAVPAGDAAARTLFEAFGFAKAGEVTTYEEAGD